jgi:hypothetical protein
MKKLVDPEQRMRTIKVLAIVLAAIILLVYGFAYIYQNVWPKKPILVDTIENQPGFSTNR